MHIDLVELWTGMSNLVRAVVIALTIQALATIYVTLDRMMLLFFAKLHGRKFAKLAGPQLARGDYEAAVGVAREHQGSHLAGYLVTAVETFLAQRRNGQSDEKAAQFADRALQREADGVGDSLNRGMNILASTGSTAPFIGLLGTVLGILNAFRLVGQEGSGGIGTIGVAIAEALIVTGYGLMVAIPSVLLFNWLSARIAKYEAGLERARGELIDRLESGVGRAQTPAAQAADTAAEPSAQIARSQAIASA
jgi:biopolymer transport protein ExbB/TolQ